MENEVSAPSESAEDSLKSLQAEIDKNTSALLGMSKAMKGMKGGGMVKLGDYLRLASIIISIVTGIIALKQRIDLARGSSLRLGDSFDRMGRKGRWRKIQLPGPARGGMRGMGASAKSMLAPLAKVGAALVSIVVSLAAVAVVVLVVVAAVAALIALVAVTVALAAATAKATTQLLRYAAAQADATRAEQLRLQGLGTLRRWMGLTMKDADAMSAAISSVASRVPIARSEVAKLGTAIHRIGVRGQAAAYALEAVALAQSAQGDVGARRMMAMVRAAGRSEQAMADLARRARKELGSTVAGQMRLLSTMATKLQESLQELFADIDVSPLTESLYELSQMFTQNTQEGRALKDIAEALLEPLIGEIAEVGPALQSLFTEIVVLALRAAVAITDVQIVIQGAFGGRTLGRILESEQAMHGFRIAIIAVAVIAVALLLILGNLVVVAIVLGVILAAPFIILAAALYVAYLGVRWLLDQLQEAHAVMSTVPWGEVGRSIIDGIVGGLHAGAERLFSAIRGVATGAMNTFREVLGIQSPSTVFAGFGIDISRGVAQGIDEGAPAAEGAAANMMQSTAATGVNSVTNNSRSADVGEIHIHLAPGDNEDNAAAVTDALRDFFEFGLATEPV